ncbi:MAG: hypothetical protein JW950_13080 [Deltaproteobacteria bacterium]|nr:hypothetical protein [Deltaproteobacteria bacterium]
MGLAISIVSLVIGHRLESDRGMVLSFEIGALFLIGITAIVHYRVSQFQEDRRGKKKLREAKPLDTSGPYVARYDRSESWLILILSAVSVTGLVHVFMGNLALKLLPIILAFAIFGVFSTIVYFTKIMFTPEGISVKSLWFRRITEPYSNITRILYRITGIEIAFADGRSMKIRNGLGERKIVSAYLEKYSPPSVDRQLIGLFGRRL